MTIPQRVFEETILAFLAPVAQFLEDPTVTEVMINGPFEIFVERRGRIERTDARFDGPHALAAAVRNLAQYAGRHVSEDRPILEAHLPDGSRVEAVMPPVSPDGPHVSIRRFSRQALSMEQLVEWNSLTTEAANFL
ncbi:MAG TPA: ATPase, T2SS/T4P/T4SS family, partial [Kofleriaceae bacterium]